MSIRVSTGVELDKTVVHVSGWLRSEDVGELNREFRATIDPAVLELSQLQSADPEGAKAISALASRGVEIRGASGYIGLLLQRHSNESA
jgi:hypothetical protein